ncbi:hypothetical protein WA158_007788 [Blastocystis sp. Blastoise]
MDRDYYSSSRSSHSRGYDRSRSRDDHRSYDSSRSYHNNDRYKSYDDKRDYDRDYDDHYSRRDRRDSYDDDDYYHSKRSRNDYSNEDKSSSAYSRENRSRERKPRRPTPKQNPPSNSVALRGLKYTVTEAMIWNAVEEYHAIGCRLMSDYVDGKSKGFAFVDFPTVEDATTFLQLYSNSSDIGMGNRTFLLGGWEVTLEYTDNARKGSGKNVKYNIDNNNNNNNNDKYNNNDNNNNKYNNRRSECFTCKAPRSSLSKDIERYIFDFSVTPSNHLLIAGIGSDVTQEQVSEMISNYCKYTRIHIYKDSNGFPRGYCIADLESRDAAMHVISFRDKNNLKIGGYEIKIGYANEQAVMESYNTTMNYISSTQIQEDLKNRTITNPNNRGDTNTSNPNERKWPSNFETNGSDYIFDASSGYYYESTSQFYYLFNRKLYLDSISGNYYSFSSSTSTFDLYTPSPPTTIYTPTINTTQSATSTTTDSTSNNNNTDININNNTQIPTTISPKPQTAMQSVSLSIPTGKTESKPLVPTLNIQLNKLSIPTGNDNHDIKEEETVPALVPGQIIEIKVKTFGSRPKKESKPEPEKKVVVKEESNTPPPITGMTASGKYACFVCKRQFTVLDQLQKHIEQSKLHIASMEEYNKKYGSAIYRNRAEERRREEAIVNSVIPTGNDETDSRDYSTSEASVSKPPQLENTIGAQMLKSMGWNGTLEDSPALQNSISGGKGLGFGGNNSRGNMASHDSTYKSQLRDAMLSRYEDACK